MAAREGYTELQARVLAARRVWKRTLFWTGCAIAIVGLIAILAGAGGQDLCALPQGSDWATRWYSPLRLSALYTRSTFGETDTHDVALHVERKHRDLEVRRRQRPSSLGEVETEIRSIHLLQRSVTMLWNGPKDRFKATVDKRKDVVLRLLCRGCALLALIFPPNLTPPGTP